MKALLFHIAIWLVLGSKVCLAQTGVYIPAGADIAVHRKDTVAIFSNVKNEGRFGSLNGAVINFYGSKWENGNEATLPDENDYNNFPLQNAGGTFRFLQRKGVQYIFGGYNASTKAGASFPNLNAGNKDGIYLEDLSDLKVRYTLHFEIGHIILNGWNLVIGNRYPGSITGYSDSRFIVTGHQPGGGFLYREHVSPTDSMVVFPLGTNTGSYSPMALRNNSGAAADIHARVFDSVYQHAVSGSTNAMDYVLKTWNIGQEAGVRNDVTVWVQHMQEDEGITFAANRDSSFVTRYINGSGWDTLKPSGLADPGMLTSGAPLGNAYMNTRTFHDGLEQSTYLSALAYSAPFSDVSLFFEAHRQTIRWVNTRWQTTKELNLLRYELQRRRETEDSFYTIARIAPYRLSGTTNTPQTYRYQDDNLYDNWTYYRLKIFGKDGKIHYSNVRKVPWLIQITVSPNPNNGNFRITVFGIRHKLRMVMHDMLGRQHDSRIIDGDTYVSKTDLPAGMYILTFYDTEDNNRAVNSTKIEIIGN
jgi:hypothetical protein